MKKPVGKLGNLFFSFQKMQIHSITLSIFFLCIWLIYHFSCFLSNWIPFFSVISFLISLFAIDLLKPFWNAFQFRRRSCVSGFARFLTLFPTFGDRLSRKSWFFLSYLDNCMGVVVVAAVVAGQRVAEPIGEGGVYADHLGNRLPRRMRHCGTKGVVQNSSLMNEPSPPSLGESVC